MDFNILSQETIIHSFPPISFPFSTQLSDFATSEESILQKIGLFHHTLLIYPKSRIWCAKRDWNPCKKWKCNHRIQILFMLVMYSDDILNEPRNHGLDKTAEKQMENSLENWVYRTHGLSL